MADACKELSGVVIPGSRSLSRVDENLRGGEIILPDEDIIVIRKLVDEADVVRTCYPEGFVQDMEGNCIPLSEWQS